jgi:peptidoglycan/xylan/chitin deacetylase (PgdA/CDA1 family)
LQQEKKILYLTFDDGPTPYVTEKVLEILEKYHAKATFFCLGKNIELFPTIFEKTKQSGHTVANHSYSHPKGWTTKTTTYLQDIKKAEIFFDNNLFRPPYGKITPRQYWLLRKKYKVVFWNVLSRDYNPKKTVESCFNYVKKSNSNDIIVFHDSHKAAPRMLETLEKTLIYFTQKGFEFHKILN